MDSRDIRESLLPPLVRHEYRQIIINQTADDLIVIVFFEIPIPFRSKLSYLDDDLSVRMNYPANEP